METASAKRRPRVFLLKFGDPEQSGARAAFSTYFFACAGYDIIDPPPVGDLKVAISQAQNAGPDILVLCSSDKHYPEIAGTVGKAMHEKSILAVAGQPGNMKEELEVYGFKHFIHMDLDLLDSLRNFNRLLLTFNS
jgi:methylmalonyl-CoA mutase